MIHRARSWIMRCDLSDEEWVLLEPLLPKSRKRARVDDRKIMNAIFYVLRTTMPWQDLPARYGPYTTAYNRFNRWSRRASGSAFSINWHRNRATVSDRQRHRESSPRGEWSKGGEKSGDQHQPGWPDHENPRDSRQQRNRFAGYS